MTSKEVFNRLMTVGGFPKPFLDGDEREARRWRRERFDRVLKEDIRDLESIRHISLLDLFIHQLKTRVGSLIVATLKHPYSSGKINVVDPVTYFLQNM